MEFEPAKQATAGPHVTLVLGGARSGKSRHAQQLAEAAAERRIFIATAEAFDDEMRDRIAHHRAARGAGWETIEAPYALADAIREASGPDRVILIDCLTIWASNLLLSDSDIGAATDDLVAALADIPCPVILVANEVGLGIVPDNALARRFRDVAGLLNQRIGASADQVLFMAAGLAMKLK